MKALSLTQPYANFIRDGLKTIETRTRPTKHRGPLLICATKKRVMDPKTYKVIEPRGVAVCIVTIINCRPMTKEDEKAACFEWNKKLWAWELDFLHVIEPFPVRGMLGIFNVDYKRKSNE